MPYIVTTKRPQTPHSSQLDNPSTTYKVSRRAVATLEEAQQEAWSDCLGEQGLVRAKTYAELTRFSKSGGTVGPLPDGTLITVEDTDYVLLRAAVGMPFGDETTEKILDAFNAQQAKP